ncbi:hypothetical protein BCR42DRAFT_129480 [Absidia repens]|uniref:Uncharacterized protein n=1 Tax=Absidia repens TaxID=90262 RepID=A0A1X2IVN8_9FUNG|nr:hypothetical protein BCR42DRAFT_129480 [Absidia repens]
MVTKRIALDKALDSSPKRLRSDLATTSSTLLSSPSIIARRKIGQKEHIHQLSHSVSLPPKRNHHSSSSSNLLQDGASSLSEATYEQPSVQAKWSSGQQLATPRIPSNAKTRPLMADTPSKLPMIMKMSAPAVAKKGPAHISSSSTPLPPLQERYTPNFPRLSNNHGQPLHQNEPSSRNSPLEQQTSSTTSLAPQHYHDHHFIETEKGNNSKMTAYITALDFGNESLCKQKAMQPNRLAIPSVTSSAAGETGYGYCSSI